MNILGVSAYYHDSAAALVRDGRLLAAVQEERFSRRKHDPRFPRQSIDYCLTEGGLRLCDLDYIVFYDKPLLKFERLLETYLACAPRGFPSFLNAMPVWLKEKLYLKSLLRSEFAALAGVKARDLPALMFTEHHQSHAASAFFPSPFERAAVLCMDGVGEWATTSVWIGERNALSARWEIDFPHSLGLLYSAFTYYTGFKVNSGEYKLMGLAPYGEPRYAALILERLLDLKEDGTFRMDMRYFDYLAGQTMTNERFHDLFGGPPRLPESPLTQREMDIAASIQAVTEECVLRLGRTVHRELGAKNLCLAGGVALNCVANGRLLREGPFEGIWVQPAAGDAGGAVGAALTIWHQYLGREREPADDDQMDGAYLGPRFGDEAVRRCLDTLGARYERLEDGELMPRLAEILARGEVVGWFQGRMEFGPRALGARSIVADPRKPGMQSVLNERIKRRESFRPFAPSVRAERASEYFDMDGASPYMAMVVPVREELRAAGAEPQQRLSGLDKLGVAGSRLPGVTHVDFTARVQTVHRDTNPRYYDLIRHFEAHTGCPVLLNTSFNVRGEPIVCTPEDAYRCFMETGMDVLVIENFLLVRADQSAGQRDPASTQAFELD